jgi:hypothetical protein
MAHNEKMKIWYSPIGLEVEVELTMKEATASVPSVLTDLHP